MLLDLKRPVQKGDPVKGTLTFEKAGSIEVEYNVVGVGETPGGSAVAPSDHNMPGMRMSH
jgi:copper(I)-binding protein